MNVVMIVQARMGSARLPGKVLLPAAGKPMLAHLLARLERVRNANQIVVATSDSVGDDAIVEFGVAQGVEVFRGSESDVLSRFWSAAAHYGADAVVRLTADCPLIDPAVIESAITTYLQSPEDLLYASNIIERTYPRGMDVEVFSRRLLDLAHREASSSYDREHVTSLMIRNERNLWSNRAVMNEQNLSAYRFTLDYRKDYWQLSRLLETDLPDYSWRVLLQRAAELGLDWHDNAEGSGIDADRHDKIDRGWQNGLGELSRFGLGTAQFGMYYGSFNLDGVPSREAVGAILKRAREFGMTVVDTASQYGEAESILGRYPAQLQEFEVITKTPSFGHDHITAAHAKAVRDSFEASIRLLGLPAVSGLLIHHAPDLLAPGGGRLYDEIRQLKDAGLVKRIGISAYSGAVIEEIVGKFDVDLVQVPVNVFDRRLLDTGILTRLVDAGIEVHARSAFLQGLLLANPDAIPSRFNGVRSTLRAFHGAARDAGLRPAHAALHFLLGIPEISRIVVGVESVPQLNDIFEDFPDEAGMDFSPFRIDEIQVIDPVSWVK